MGEIAQLLSGRATDETPFSPSTDNWDGKPMSKVVHSLWVTSPHEAVVAMDILKYFEHRKRESKGKEILGESWKLEKAETLEFKMELTNDLHRQNPTLQFVRSALEMCSLSDK